MCCHLLSHGEVTWDWFLMEPPGWFLLFLSWRKHRGRAISKYNPLPLVSLVHSSQLSSYDFLSPGSANSLEQWEDKQNGQEGPLRTRGGQLHSKNSQAGGSGSRLQAPTCLWSGLWWVVTQKRCKEGSVCCQPSSSQKSSTLGPLL